MESSYRLPCCQGIEETLCLTTSDKSGANTSDLLSLGVVFWSILEYAVWQNIPEYLCNSIESIQKRALKIIYPDCSYDQALVLTN